jgi:hypothetical protein
VKYLVGDRGLNLAGVQLAMEATHHLRALQDWLGPHAESRPDPNLDRAREQVAALLNLLGATES